MTKPIAEGAIGETNNTKDREKSLDSERDKPKTQLKELDGKIYRLMQQHQKKKKIFLKPSTPPFVAPFLAGESKICDNGPLRIKKTILHAL